MPGADSYGVQMYRNGQWTDLPGDGIEIAFYGAGAIISELEPEGSSYWFRVRARSVHGFSEWSDFNFMASTNESKSGRRARPDNVPASGTPVISGAAQVGETLTADTTDVEDGNGLDRVQFRFQWVSHDGGADTDIASETDSTYTLAASDEGKTIRVRVAFTDRGGYAESLTSEAMEAVSFAVRQQQANSPATGTPAITGTAQVGDTLTADISGIADDDGLVNAIYSYQWVANDGTADSDITGATDSTYTLVAPDEGKTIKVNVSFTDDAGNEETLTSSATAAVDAAPNTPATGAPAITGTAQVGERLTVDTSGIADADGLTKVSYSYQWVANDGTSDTDITGATDSTYTLAAADEGKAIKVKVSFTDDAGNGESLTSAATGSVAPRPNRPATGSPTITGTAEVGEILTANTSGISDADGLASATFAYQWLADDAELASATGGSYVLTTSEMDKTIKVRVSFTDDAGNEETLTSTATGTVSPAVQPQTANSPATGAPIITGTAEVGEILTASTSGIADADGLSGATFSYQWVASDRSSDTDIADATDSTYTLVAADEGKTIKVRVSFTDDAGTDETLTSTETEAVSFAVQQQVANSPATGAPTISGAAQVGEALTADTSGIADTDGLVNATFRYQWMRNDGTSETDIQNATGSTYTLVDNDEGQTIKVKVSFTDDAGNDETLSSGATDAVTAPECDNIGDCDIEDVDDLLLPDLVSYQHDYSVAEVVATPDGTEFFALRFAGFVTNLGDGPLDLRGNPQLADDADLTSHDVWQRALTIDGDWVNLTKPPIDFEVDDGHDHFHVMGIVEYSLWDTSGTVEISSGAKIGFCLIDVMERPDLHANPGPKRHEQWDPDNYYCQSGRPRAKILHMGISEGWQDIYSFSETFQWIDVSDVQPGYYRIGQRVDPDNVIVESDETNNELVLTQRLQVVPGYVARPEMVSVEPDAAVRFKLSVDEYFDDTNLEDGSPRTRAHRIVTQPSHGSLDVGDTVTVIVDGATYQVFTDEWVTYTPDPGYTGADSFTFVALDESLPRYPINPVVATVTLDITGAPTIRGTAQVGETLTADTSGIGDTDSITGISYSYQWVRNDGTNDTDITGATDSTYTMVVADEGRTIKVGVSFTDDAGNEETLTSAATSSVTARPEQGIAPNAPDLPIGTAVFVGGVDLEWNEVPVADSYDVQLYQNGQWIDLPGDGVEIAFYGAGAIISGLDPSLTLWFQVRARNAHGSSDWSDFSSLSSTNQFTLGKRARSANEAARGAPVINGTAQVGEILTADTTGIEDGNGLDRVQFRFQWATNDGSADTDIAGATNSTYTLAGSDEGKTIKVRVAFTDRGGYAESLTSDATETVSFAGQQQIANNPATGGPIIGGTARVGETLATDVLGIADEDGLENATFSYQWISNDGTTDADIQGETGATYTLTDANKGKTVKVRVSFTDDADNEETVTSAATATVAARPNRPATGAPIIGGTVRVGETLATDVLGIVDEDGLENATFSYQWISNDGTTDADIQGETGATYTLTDANEGKTVKVRVSFTDDADNEETVTSAATATVAARPNRPATGTPTISGTAQVGEMLTADTSGIADADRLTNVSYSYQWIANDGTAATDITGATDSTYTLVSADEGKTIKVRVSFTDDADNGETLTSMPTAVVAAPAQVDSENEPSELSHLTVVVTEDDSDPDDVVSTFTITWNDAEDCSSSYNAYLDGVVGEPIHLGSAASEGEQIAGSLTNVSAEAFGFNVKLHCGTIGSDRLVDRLWIPEYSRSFGTLPISRAYLPKPGTYSTEPGLIALTVSSGTLTPAFHNQTLNYTVPDVPNADGRFTLTTTAKADYYTVAFLPGSYHTFFSVCSHGGQQTSLFYGDDAGNQIYPLTDADANTPGFQMDLDEGENVFYIRVWPNCQTGQLYKLTVTRAANAPANTPATGAPTIGGTARVGQTLTADTTGIADSDGLENATFAYQWLADDTDIADATDSTYTLVAAAEGKTIKVRVSFTDDADNDETLTSAATGEVEALPNRPATGAPTISGTAQVWEALTADTSGIADDDGLNNVSYSYQWLADDADIAGATASTYSLVAADEGQTIKVEVSFTDDAGNDETLTSTATAAVEAPEPPAMPTGLSPSVSHDTVTLTWDDPQDDSITGYVILRRDRAIHPVGTFVTLTDDTGSADTTYTDDTVEPDKQYVYRIKAINEHGEVSEISDWVRANTPAVPVPDKPTGLSAVVSHDAVTLTWDDPQDDSITGYVILRRDRAIHPVGTFVTIAGDTGSADTTYTDDTVEPEKEYVYKIKAINEHGEMSERSDWVRDFTPAAPPTDSPATGEPTITGTAQVGRTLTSDTSGISDDDGLDNAVFAYQWLSDDAEISGATGSTYNLVDDDEGRTIKVRVTVTDDLGNETTLTSADTDAVEAAAQPDSPATGEPTITGTAQVGRTLTADTSGIADEDGLNSAVFAYQWLSDDAEIGGATGSTYTLVAGDEGQTIKVRVTVTDDLGNETTLTSAATEAVAAAPPTDSPATGEPTITGTAQVGRTLTADTSGIADADGLNSAVFAYQWLSDDAEIGGATGLTYTLVDDDEGRTIKVRVTVTDDLGNETTLTSAATEAVEAKRNTAATGRPAISGTVRVGETLTADTTGIEDADGLTNVSYGYQWVVTDGGTHIDISGETGATYTLVSADRGLRILVRVTFTDDAGKRERLTSAATDVVAAAA